MRNVNSEYSSRKWNRKRILVSFYTQFLVICVCSFLIHSQNAQCEDLDVTSQYEKMLAVFPSLKEADAQNWRMARGNDHSNERHPCKRECEINQPMTCYYYMIIHYDATMGKPCKSFSKPEYLFKVNNEQYIEPNYIETLSHIRDDCKYADGVPVDLMLVNGRFPGQAVEVCLGDTIIADVINTLREPTTLHWHGMHQRKAPHMDGVPYITQYPIEPGQAYRYTFEVDHAGTNWWHSHTNWQREMGIGGALIVRQPSKTDPHRGLYDFDLSEHIMIFQDWRYNPEMSEASGMLINARGKNMNLKTNNDKKQPPPTLYAAFHVTRGGRYRFRAIYNGVTNCPVTLSIDEHKLIVIASDGNDVEPINVDAIVFNAGERYDFVVTANQAIANYWIRLQGHNICDHNKIHQQSILRYKGASQKDLPGGITPFYGYERNGIELNSIDRVPDGNSSYFTVVDMNSIAKQDQDQQISYRKHYISMSTETEKLFRFQLDEISFKPPKLSFLQSRNLGIEENFCNKSILAKEGKNCEKDHCSCANIINVPAFEHVEFVVYSLTFPSHPIHLHGYTFRVVGMGVLGKDRIRDIENIDRQTPFARRTSNAPLKDTVQVPAYGYAIIRFYTDSPGYWLFHCHISPHSENGMAAVVRVGDNAEMKMCPVTNCGLCGSVF